MSMNFVLDPEPAQGIASPGLDHEDDNHIIDGLKNSNDNDIGKLHKRVSIIEPFSPDNNTATAALQKQSGSYDEVQDQKLSNRKGRVRQSMSKRFSIKFSTEQNNQTDEKTFYGPYRHLKKEMDYDYHRYGWWIIFCFSSALVFI